MTREQWLTLCWIRLLRDVQYRQASHSKKGGQQVTDFSPLAGVPSSQLFWLERFCKDALETREDWYEDISYDNSGECRMCAASTEDPMISLCQSCMLRERGKQSDVR